MCVTWMIVVEVAGEGEELFGTGVVRGVGVGHGGLNFGEENFARRLLEGAVDEEDGCCVSDVFGEVGGPLLAGDYADCWSVSELLLRPLGEVWADAIIRAEGVAAGEDEAVGLQRGHLLIVDLRGCAFPPIARYAMDGARGVCGAICLRTTADPSTPLKYASLRMTEVG